MTTTTTHTRTTYTVVYPPHIGRILQAVAKAFSVPMRELVGTTRVRRVVEARQAAMALLHTHGRMASTEIGTTLGRDHTTVLWGWQQCEARCASDGDYRWMFEQAKRALVHMRDEKEDEHE